MSRTGLNGALTLAALVALGLAGGARSQTVEMPYTPRAMARNGEVIMMPEIAGLDCAGMKKVLRRIDNSNYRGPGPLHVGHPDWLIFEYEDTLARQHYFSCVLVESRMEDPSTAFSFGFEPQ